MSTKSCARRWEAEALHDGLLHGTGRASFERHLGLCSRCADTLANLRLGAERLRSLEVPTLDEISVRRKRQQLLAGTHAAQENKRRHGSTWLFAGASLLLLIAALAIVRRKAIVAPPPVLAVARSSSVTASNGARWSMGREGTLERIELLEGELAIETHHRPGDRLLVIVPDGEIEDVGTRFVVAVHQGHVQRIAVSEGAVSLRRNGSEPLRLDAPASWAAPPIVTPPIVTPPIVAPPIVASVAPPPLTTAIIPVAKTASPKVSATAPVADVGAAELRSAVALFRSGEHRAAARDLHAFVIAHPNDPRAEDAAYLRVIALDRAGDKAQARAAANDYLQRFPQGFRRTEISALASAP